MAKLISIANMKGGVGKTTTSVALAKAFATAEGGGNALLVDLDAQANASFWVCGDAALTALIEKGETIDAFLEDAVVFGKPVALKDYIHPAVNGPANLSVIPSSPWLRVIERELIVFLSRRQRSLLEVERVVSDLFNAQVREIAPSFDFVIFDTAPGMSALNEAALRASDLIVIPTVPDFISNLGLEAFCKTVHWSNKEGMRKPWVVANMVKGTVHHRLMLEEMRAEAAADDGGYKMFETQVPNETWIEEAASDAEGEGARKLTGAEGNPFSALAAEIRQILARATPVAAAS